MGASSEMFWKWEQTKSYNVWFFHKKEIKTGVELAENVWECEVSPEEVM
jgi:hypothetical protein